jgi:hypothetical protein
MRRLPWAGPKTRPPSRLVWTIATLTVTIEEHRGGGDGVLVIAGVPVVAVFIWAIANGT